MPGLDRLLYELDGGVLQQLPVTVDTMMEGGLAMQGSVLAGSREKTVQGLDVHSGKVGGPQEAVCVCMCVCVCVRESERVRKCMYAVVCVGCCSK